MKRFLLYVLALVLVAACEEINSDFQDPNVDNIESPIIGAWSRTDIYTTTYYFLNNGEGYLEKLKKSSDGILRNSFDWKLEGDLLIIKFHNSSSEHIYDVEFDTDGGLTLSSDGYKYEYKDKYKRVSKDGTTDVDYKNPPYRNYMCIFGYYYEVSKVVMKCDHSTGTESNSKYLIFFGSNGLTEPVGVRFMTFTPYYDGINATWYDGVYKIKSDYALYQYGATYCVNNSWSSRCDGKLTIETLGNITIIDFTLDDGDVTGHVSGIFD